MYAYPFLPSRLSYPAIHLPTWLSGPEFDIIYLVSIAVSRKTLQHVIASLWDDSEFGAIISLSQSNKATRAAVSEFLQHQISHSRNPAKVFQIACRWNIATICGTLINSTGLDEDTLAKAVPDMFKTLPNLKDRPQDLFWALDKITFKQHLVARLTTYFAVCVQYPHIYQTQFLNIGALVKKLVETLVTTADPRLDLARLILQMAIGSHRGKLIFDWPTSSHDQSFQTLIPNQAAYSSKVEEAIKSAIARQNLPDFEMLLASGLTFPDSFHLILRQWRSDSRFEAGGKFNSYDISEDQLEEIRDQNKVLLDMAEILQRLNYRYHFGLCYCELGCGLYDRYVHLRDPARLLQILSKQLNFDWADNGSLPAIHKALALPSSSTKSWIVQGFINAVRMMVDHAIISVDHNLWEYCKPNFLGWKYLTVCDFLAVHRFREYDETSEYLSEAQSDLLASVLNRISHLVHDVDPLTGLTSMHTAVIFSIFPKSDGWRSQSLHLLQQLLVYPQRSTERGLNGNTILHFLCDDDALKRASKVFIGRSDMTVRFDLKHPPYTSMCDTGCRNNPCGGELAHLWKEEFEDTNEWTEWAVPASEEDVFDPVDSIEVRSRILVIFRLLALQPWDVDVQNNDGVSVRDLAGKLRDERGSLLRDVILPRLDQPYLGRV